MQYVCARLVRLSLAQHGIGREESIPLDRACERAFHEQYLEVPQLFLTGIHLVIDLQNLPFFFALSPMLSNIAFNFLNNFGILKVIVPALRPSVIHILKHS